MNQGNPLKKKRVRLGLRMMNTYFTWRTPTGNVHLPPPPPTKAVTQAAFFALSGWSKGSRETKGVIFDKSGQMVSLPTKSGMEFILKRAEEQKKERMSDDDIKRLIEEKKSEEARLAEEARIAKEARLAEEANGFYQSESFNSASEY